MDFDRNMSRAKLNLVNIRCCTIVLRVMQYRNSAILIQKSVRGWIARKHGKKDVNGENL
jgi:hypothetical protein